MAALLVVVACDKGASTRLYTDDEIAAIEAKASKRASRHPDELTDTTTLSLRAPLEALEKLRSEPNVSVAARRAVEQLAEVRRLGEGEPTIVRMFVIQSGETAIADTLHEILQRGGLQAADLDALAAAIDQLVATEPRLAPAFEGDFRWLRGSFLYGHFTPSSGAHSSRDEMALTLAMVDELEPLLASACPPLASLSSCHRQLPPRAGQLMLPGQLLDNAADQIRARDDSARRRLQADLAHRVAMNQLGAYSFYAERAATDVSRLIALRVEIEVLRKRTCDVPRDLLSPDVLGEPVRLTTLEHSLRIEPPAWAATGSRKIESWTFACP